MAQSQIYNPSQNVSVWIQNEAIVGTEPDDAALKRLQAVSFTIPEASVPLEFSSPRSGQFITTATQGHHSEGTKLWTFETTLRGTPTSVLLATEAVFEQSSSTAELDNDYIFPTTGYTVATGSGAKTFDIRFVNGGTKAAAETIECAGCVGTGFTLSEDIGSEGGELVCTISWATGFMPVHSATDISSPAYDEGTPKNIRNLALTTAELGSGNDLVVSSWEISCNRTIERVHYADITSGTFAPFGYAMTGGFEISGSLTVIRNETVHDILASFYNSTTLDLKLAEASNFSIDMDKVLLGESTVDNGGAVLMQTIPFTAVADEDIGGSSEQVLGITIA
tara:strand:+ start:9390 stop:10400 length:1011 start_codon:yes stop_codon:yes gene_type:complete